MATTYLNKDQLNHFKDRLLTMKQTNKDDLSDDNQDSTQDSTQEISEFQNHPANQGTELFEQEMDKGFDMMSRDNIIDINNALNKIEDNTYGLSEKSGKPIPLERLEALPTARNLVEEEN